MVYILIFSIIYPKYMFSENVKVLEHLRFKDFVSCDKVGESISRLAVTNGGKTPVKYECVLIQE